MISPALGIGLFVAYLLLRNPRVSPVGGTENYGVMDKLLLCGKLVEAGMDSQAATEQLAATLRYVKPGDNKNELTVIYNRMDSMRYTNGPSNKDIIRGFGRAVSDKIGDCADKTVYGGVLLGMAGFPVRLKLVLPRGGRQWHIYPLAGVPKHNPSRWVAVDPVYGRGIGREAPYYGNMVGIYDVTQKKVIKSIPY